MLNVDHIDDDNVKVLEEYFYRHKKQKLLVDLDEKRLYLRSFMGRVFRAAAVVLSLIAGFFNSYLFLLTPIIFVACYFQNEDFDDIAQTAHQSLIKKQINSLLMNDDCSLFADLRQKVDSEFGQMDSAVKSKIIQLVHDDLFASRLKILKNDELDFEKRLEEEKPLREAQERITLALEGPSLSSVDAFKLNCSSIAQILHADLFALRLKVLCNESLDFEKRLEQEKLLEEAQERISSAMESPSFLSNVSFQTERSFKIAKFKVSMSCTKENAISIASAVLDYTLGQEASLGFKSAAFSAAHMVRNGPSKSAVCQLATGLTIFTTEQMKDNLSKDEKLCARIAEYSDSQLYASNFSPLCKDH